MKGELRKLKEISNTKIPMATGNQIFFIPPMKSFANRLVYKSEQSPDKYS
jgi:hypothetical protein